MPTRFEDVPEEIQVRALRAECRLEAMGEEKRLAVLRFMTATSDDGRRLLMYVFGATGAELDALKAAIDALKE